MTPRELLEAFETLADAPDGVKRLRELVLQLAVRGKLVPQDSSEGRVSPSKVPPSPDEVSFRLPEQWAWLRLPEVADYSVGKTPPTKDSRFWGTDEIPWVSIGDMPDGGVVRATARTVTQDAAAEVFRKPKIPAGSLLMSFKLTIGKVAFLGIDAYHNEAIISLSPSNHVSKNYLFRVLPLRAIGGESKAAIMGSTLNGQSLARILVPLAPLPEQHRIVARVDELMGLLDRLEAARAVRDGVRHAARDAALAALSSAEDTEAVEIAWDRISGKMNALFKTPEDILLLRKTIRHLAVRGRIVPQNAVEQPAEELLAEVHAERKRRWPSQKKPYLQPSHREWEGLSDVLPPGWSVASIEGLTDPVRTVSYGILMPGEDVSGGVPYVKVKNIHANEGCIIVDEVRRTTVEIHQKYLRSELTAGDVLVSIRGTVGKVAPVPAALEGGNITQDSARLAFLKPMHVPYLMLVMRSPPVQAYWAELNRVA